MISLESPVSVPEVMRKRGSLSLTGFSQWASLGLADPEPGLTRPTAGTGFADLDIALPRYHRKYSTRAMRLECMGKAARVARQVWLASAPDLTPVSWASPIPTKSQTARVSSEEAVYRRA